MIIYSYEAIQEYACSSKVRSSSEMKISYSDVSGVYHNEYWEYLGEILEVDLKLSYDIWQRNYLYRLIGGIHKKLFKVQNHNIFIWLVPFNLED